MFILAIFIFYLYRLLRASTEGINFSLIKALLSGTLLVIFVLIVMHDEYSRVSIPSAFIELLCFFSLSYIITFLASFIVPNLDALKYVSVEIPGYRYTFDLYFPITPAYGEVRFFGKSVLRLTATFRESGIAQLFYVWAYSESDYYFSNKKFTKIMLIIGIIACQSTAGYFSFLIYLAFKMFVRFLNAKKISNLWSVLGLAILIVFVYWIYTSIPQLNLITKNAYSTGARIGNLRDVYGTLREHPLFGADTVDYNLYGNSLLQLSANIGLLGLLLYLHIIFRAFLLSDNKQRFILSLLAMFVTLFISQPICDTPIVFMMMVMPYSYKKNDTNIQNNSFSEIVSN